MQYHGTHTPLNPPIIAIYSPVAQLHLTWIGSYGLFADNKTAG